MQENLERRKTKITTAFCQIKENIYANWLLNECDIYESARNVPIVSYKFTINYWTNVTSMSPFPMY